MKRFINIIALLGTLFCIYFIKPVNANKLAQKQSYIEFFVSPEGNDTWSGTHKSPNYRRTDGPFRTPEKAIRAVQNIEKDFLDSIVVNFMSGRYSLNVPLILNGNSSGTETCPVIWRNYDHKEVIFSGARKIRKIQRLRLNYISSENTDIKGYLYHINITDPTIGKCLFFTNKGPSFQVLVDSQPLEMSSYPDNGWFEYSLTSDYQSRHSEIIQIQIKDHPGTPPIEDSNAILFGYWFHDWSGEYQKFRYNPNKHDKLEILGFKHDYGYRDGQRFKFYNSLQGLNKSGEFYFDAKSNRIYFLSEKDNIDEVEINCNTNNLIVANNLRYTKFDGLIFESCKGPAIELLNCEQVRFYNCQFRNILSDALVIEGGNNVHIDHCIVKNTGAGGIVLKGGDRQTLLPGKHEVNNTKISNFANIQKTYKPAIYVMGVGNIIRNCRIYNAPHMGIYIKGNNHMIEKNEFYALGQETGDVGAIYLGRDWSFRGNTIQYNYFHDLHAPGKYGITAVYLDDFISGTLVKGNIFNNCQRAVMIGGGRDNIIENNLFAHCDISIQIDNRGIERRRNTDLNEDRWGLIEKLNDVDHDNLPYNRYYPELAYILDNNPYAPLNNIIKLNAHMNGEWILTNPARKRYWDDIIIVEKNFINTQFIDNSNIALQCYSLDQKMKSLYPEYQDLRKYLDQYFR